MWKRWWYGDGSISSRGSNGETAHGSSAAASCGGPYDEIGSKGGAGVVGSRTASLSGSISFTVTQHNGSSGVSGSSAALKSAASGVINSATPVVEVMLMGVARVLTVFLLQWVTF